MGRHASAYPGHFTDTYLARIMAGLASISAGAIHLLMTGDHLREWWAAGLFFAAITMFQIGWAVAAILRGDTLIMLAGLLANAGSIALWAVSRTIGMPFGPHAWAPEPAALPDMLTVAMEAVVCTAVLWSLRRSPREIRSVPMGVGSVGVAAAVMVMLTVPGVNAALAGHSHGTGTGHGHDHGSEENPGRPAPSPTRRTEDPTENTDKKSPRPHETDSKGDNHDPDHDDHDHAH